LKHIIHWYRAQSKSKRVVLGCALLIGVFALYGLGGAARQSLATVSASTPTPTPNYAPMSTTTPTPASTPTPTSTSTPKSANRTNPLSGLPGFTHQTPGNVLTQQKTLLKPSATSVNKVPLHTTPTPQATATATTQPQGTPTPTPEATATMAPCPTCHGIVTSTPTPNQGTLVLSKAVRNRIVA
jgi:hypothetical protein